ncbi:hypothetical protein [Hydrocoleum sp. CS-953]|uniref:HalD/BesD family halogenase n=1 Tax=Hydrocoleum sp. CS-953 TaxID=1671698 RepID=UPI000B9AE88C|nr:hypothetical protein [Hydrocoleum sp. CS-953]
MSIALINDIKYPITQLNSERIQKLRDDARSSLAHTGVFILPNFLTPTATQSIVSEANKLLPQAHHMESVSSVYTSYQSKDQSSLSDTLQMLMRTSLHAIAYDQFLESSFLKELYEWEQLMNFIAIILGKDQIYRYKDELGALNLSIMYPGDELAWHFDEVDFAVSISLQSSESGGEFECAPLIRSGDGEEYNSIADILLDKSEQVTTVPMISGTLMLFEGRSSLHRVTRVTGSTPRIVALLGYDTKPNTVTSKQLRMARYGRS